MAPTKMQSSPLEMWRCRPATKKLTRYSDGVKDSLDAKGLAKTLRTDRHAYRELSVPEAHVLELRELSRSAEELTRERGRLRNRLSSQLWRYYPQLLQLSEDVTQNWVLDLWHHPLSGNRPG